MTFYAQVSLYGRGGERKYLNREERRQFYACAQQLPLERQCFCLLFYETGARFSEIMTLSVRQIDFAEKVIILRTLKRRRDDMYRAIPLRDDILGSLLALIDHKRKIGEILYDHDPLWSFASRTGSRIIKSVMEDACIDGPKASALGLRHSYAVTAVTVVPLTQVKVWMGHGSLSTTALYLNVSGIKEREWAEKLWLEF